LGAESTLILMCTKGKNPAQLSPLEGASDESSSSYGPNSIESFPFLYLMAEADPASETSYNSNLPKTMDSAQHNFIMKHKVM
jgi:hypothetical protein